MMADFNPNAQGRSVTGTRTILEDAGKMIDTPYGRMRESEYAAFKEKEAAEAAQRRRAASEAKARRYSRPSPQGSRSRTSRAHPGGSVVRLFGPGIWQERLSNMNLITPGEVRSLLEDLPPLFPQPGRKFPSPDTGHRSIA
jgi:hypothetical protein